MNKIKNLVVWFSLAFIPATLSLADDVKYAAAIHVIMEDFEQPDRWDVDFSALKCDPWENPDWVKNNNDSTTTPSTNSTGANNTPTTDKTKNNEWIKWLSTDNIAEERKLTFLPLAMQTSKNNKMILGVKGCWTRPGYNWLSISPKEPMYTPAYPVKFSVYTWGNNYKYDMYLTVKNSEGTYYNLFVGNLNYSGWRELKLNFPRYVFPANRHNDNSKLEIVRLKVFGRPNEDAIGFYVYFDNMIVQQSFDQSGLYDGSSLNDERW